MRECRLEERHLSKSTELQQSNPQLWGQGGHVSEAQGRAPGGELGVHARSSPDETPFLLSLPQALIQKGQKP